MTVRRSEVGASLVEYGLIVFAIAGMLVGTMFVLGHTIVAKFDEVSRNQGQLWSTHDPVEPPASPGRTSQSSTADDPSSPACTTQASPTPADTDQDPTTRPCGE